jgi:outer membrane receptor protein involved in Fe transport
VILMNARARQHLTTESGGYLIAITSLAASACVYCMGSTASAAEQARDAKGNIEEVIVTAQKRAERLQDVPISIAVLGGEGLDKSTVEGVTEALKRVPGVTNTVGVNGGTQLAVRGVSAGGPLFSGSSPVAYYLDSVPFGFVKTAIVPDSNAYDVERVEILRGPQGTLYGASAQNGVVRVLTRDANPDAFELKTRTSVSTTDGGGDNYRVDAALNVPLVEDKLAARAVVGYQDMDGWVDAPNRDDVNDAKLVSYRLKVNARPTENLSIGLSAWRSDNDYGAPSTSDDQGRVASVHDQSIATDYDVYGLKIAYDFAGIRLTSSTSYLDYQNIYDLGFFLPTLLTTELDSGRNLAMVAGRLLPRCRRPAGADVARSPPFAARLERDFQILRVLWRNNASPARRTIRGHRRLATFRGRCRRSRELQPDGRPQRPAESQQK